MFFSVLLNNFNYGRFLWQAIDSVLNQSFDDFELIVVDDGSTDDSREIIASFADVRLKPIFKDNGGQASAFKAGIDAARGEYVAFLDADDLWDSIKLEICAKLLQKNSDLALLNHSFRFIDAFGCTFGREHAFDQVGNYDLLCAFRNLDSTFSLVPTSFLIGRAEVCQQLEFDQQAWKVGADTPLIVGLGLRGKVFNATEVLGSYRTHGENLWYGHYDDEVLFQHTHRMYELANTEMKRLGRAETFDFTKSELALTRRIIQTSKYSPQGLWLRLRRLIRLKSPRHKVEKR